MLVFRFLYFFFPTYSVTSFSWTLGDFKVILNSLWCLPKKGKAPDNIGKAPDNNGIILKETLLLVILQAFFVYLCQAWIFPQVFLELLLYLKIITSERNLNILWSNVHISLFCFRSNFDVKQIFDTNQKQWFFIKNSEDEIIQICQF